MNMYFFGLKRAYYGTLHGPRKPLAEMGLTSARVDLLEAIRKLVCREARLSDSQLACDGPMQQSGLAPKAICYQYQIRQMLGLAASTLTEMLQALEERGWIARERELFDQRFRLVKITSRGLAMLRKARDWACDFPRSRGLGTIWGEVRGRDGRDGLWYQFFCPIIEYDEFDEFMAGMIGRFGNIGPYPPRHVDE